jgi:hypothetical protein
MIKRHPHSLLSTRPGYEGELMTTEDLKEHIGLGRYKKLPREAPTNMKQWVQNRAIRLEPLIGEAPASTSYFMRNADGSPGHFRRMKHRLKIECFYCGCFIPAGRIHQHEPYCKQRDNHS